MISESVCDVCLGIPLVARHLGCAHARPLFKLVIRFRQSLTNGQTGPRSSTATADAGPRSTMYAAAPSGDAKQNRFIETLLLTGCGKKAPRRIRHPFRFSLRRRLARPSK